MFYAVVPVKTLNTAKSRLAPILGREERRALVLAMLADVIHALGGASSLANIGIISHDPVVLAQARAAGAEALHDTAGDLNGALAQAATHSTAQGATGLLILPADLPLVTSREIEQMIELAQTTPSVVLAPSRDGGTNAMLVRTPLSMPFLFGPGSLERHRAAANARALPVHLLHSPSLELDIDTCDDLLHIIERAGTTASQLLLREHYSAKRPTCL